MKVSYWPVCFLLIIHCFYGYANAYSGCPKSQPCLYYTNTKVIKAIDVNASKYPNTKIYSVANTPAYAIDMDMNADMLYWSEQSPSWKIRRMNLSTGNIEDLITKDLGEVEGISVDWVNHNMYWTDLTYERIEVSTLSGLHRKTLFNKDSKWLGQKILLNPKAIVVHPFKGYLFWTDYHYYYPQIARSTLAGTDYQTIRDLFFTDHYLPTGLTIDFTYDRLYFIDAFNGEIESFDLNGNSRRKHYLAGHVPYPYDITVLGSMMYWADRYSHSIEAVNRTYWTRRPSFGWLGDEGIRGVVGYNASYQKPVNNTSCAVNNGNCSNLCLPTPSGRICACPNGATLLSNNRNCSNITEPPAPPKPPVVSVRLVNGRYPSEGRVEVRFLTLYGTVCDDYFGFAEANVICRMLNYSKATHFDKLAHFGQGSGVIWLDRLKCRGDEKSISECQHAPWGETDCFHYEDVGVRCDNGSQAGVVTSPYANTTGLKVRLRGALEEYEGRVEVFYQGEWGTICDRQWKLQDAHVVCRMLGYEGAWGAQGYGYFGRGTGIKIMVSDISCTGNESSIGLCYSSGWGNPTCTHAYDVAVTCKIHPSKLTDSRTVRLADGLTPNEGRVEIKHKGQWGTVCDDYWDLRDAQVACRELGYPGALSAPMRAAFGEGSGKILLSLFGCSGNENSLKDCYHSEWGALYCRHSEDASVVCRTNHTRNPQDSSSYLFVADEKRVYLTQILHQTDSTNHTSFPYVTTQGRNGLAPDQVAIDPIARDVYYTNQGQIFKSHLFHNNGTRIINQGQRITGLAIDHVCSKLYWSDYSNSRIMVSDLNGASARGLISVDSPKGIALDIRGGVMYYTGGSNTPKIYKSRMDGSNTVVLTTRTSSPSSIAYDRNNNILYWADSDRILYLNLSSSVNTPQMVSSVHVTRPYGLVVHSNYLYWTDMKSGGFTGGLYRARLTSSSSHVTELVLSGFMTPRGVASFDANNIVPENLACNDCQCTQMCLRVPSGHQCMCSGLYNLDSDNITCSVGNFFAFIDSYKETVEFLLEKALDGNKERQSVSLERSLGGLPHAIEWDPVEQRIYYTDTLMSIIARLFLNGTSQETIVSNVYEPRGLAIDLVGRNLYFTDYSSRSVSVCKLDGTMRKTLKTTPGNKPTSIAVNSETGYLYWGSWGFKSQIHRASMDGSEYTLLIEWTGSFDSYGTTQMTIDELTNRLYWVGWHESYIEYIDLSAKIAAITQLRAYASYLWMPGGIALSPTKLCWTDQFKEGMFSGNRNGTSSVQTIVNNAPGIIGLKYCKAKPNPPSAHPCASENNGHCTHLCLLKPNGYSCACPDVISLNTTCSTALPTTTKTPTTQQPTTQQPTTQQPTTQQPTTQQPTTQQPTTQQPTTQQPTTQQPTTQQPTTQQPTTQQPTTQQPTTQQPTTQQPTTQQPTTQQPTTQQPTTQQPTTQQPTTQQPTTQQPTTQQPTTQQPTTQQPTTQQPTTQQPTTQQPTTQQPTTQQPTTQQPTTQQPTTILQPTTSTLSCQSSPCQNGGTCQETENSYKCICPDYFVPEWSCEIFVGEQVVTITVTGFKEEELELLLDVLAQILNQQENPEARLRRAVKSRNIKADNIYIVSKPKQEGDKTKIPIAVIYPSNDGKISADNIMPAQTLTKKITDSKEELNKKLQSKFSNAKVLEVEPTPVHQSHGSNPHRSSKGTVAAVVVVVLLIILIATAVLIYFSRKRMARATRTKDYDNTHVSDFTTFNNPGYNEEQLGNMGPPLGDSKAMSANVHPMEDLRGATNPTYEIAMEKDEKDKEKTKPLEVAPQNMYAEIPAAMNRESAPTDATKVEEHQYDNLNWERFDEPSEQEYENLSGGKLQINLDRPEGEEDTTA